MVGYYLVELCGRVHGILAPAGEVGRAVDVAQHAESGIGQQPRAVAVDKVFVVAGGESARALLCKNLAEVLVLGGIHALVVDSRQGIELGTETLVILAAALVGEHTQLLKTQVHRVEGKARIGAVRIRVNPCAGDVCIVDGQYLEEILAGGLAPVDHLLEVVEVAYAEVFVGAQREYGYGRAGSAPGCQWIDKAHPGQHGGMARGGVNAESAVGAALPRHHLALCVDDDKLIFSGRAQARGGYRCAPLREVGIAHRHSLGGVPRAERLGRATQGQTVGGHHRGGHAQRDVVLAHRRSIGRHRTAAYAARKRSRVVRLVPGLILPAVYDPDVFCVGTAFEAMSTTPFASHCTIVMTHYVAVCDKIKRIR